MAFLVNNSKMLRLTLIQLLLLIYSSQVFSTFTLRDFCSDDTVHMSQLENYLWEYVEVKQIRSSSPSPPSNKQVPASTNSNPSEIQKYLFSPCLPLQNHSVWPKYNHSECANSTVCFIRTLSNGTVIARGYGPNGTAASLSTLHTMWLEGGECEFSNATKQQVAINFYCDKYHGLGKPIKSYTSTCQANFNWPSIAACTDKGIVRPQLSKCYVYDEKGNERDLSPLIHETGYEVVASSHSLAQFAHLATHLDKRELNVPESRINSGFYINVCSEVKHLCNTGPSDSGNMACYRNGSKVLALGDMRKTTIDYDDKSDEVVLRSSAPSVKTDDCPDGLKSVIRFKCPHHSTGEIDSYSALGSRRPFVVSTSTCEVIIEWETDYACPTQALEGNYQTCIIRDESTQRQIDLSPLKAKGFQRLSKLSINFDEFSIHPTDADDEIVLKVCNSFNITEPIHTTHCGEDWSGSSVCLRSTSEAGNSSTNSVIGSMKDAKFRYADGLVSLRYPTRKGHCVSPHLAEYVSEADGPSTLITFPCNESAGFGSPVFAGYDDCVYRIEWPTNLTCHKQDLSYSYRLMTPCTVFHKGSLYDLSLLRKSHDQLAWQASVANSALAKDQSLAKKLILLNVCSKVTKLSKLEKNITTKSLPENAAVILHSHNESKSLGRDISSPEWDEKSGGLVLRYIDNISTSSGPVMVRSTIKFGCTPGKLDSSPQLVKVSKDGKIESYEFFWPTAAACPIHEHKGNNCQVTVPNLATVIDLNPLVTDELFSHVTEDDRGYKYYINICGSLGNSPCKSKTNSSLAGICQFQKSSNRTWILGQANRNLTYWNGVLSLRYTDGDKYNDPNKTPRSAELSFVCSDDESLEMIYEANRTYFFRYYTKHACPNVINMVPCLWSNGTHSVDLGRISITQDQNHFAAKTATKSSEGSVVAFLNICRPLNPFIPADMNCRQGSAACKLIYSGNGSTKALSLGIPRFPPVLHDDQLALIYPNGDPCPKNSSILLSSKLLFICDPSAFEPVIEIATTKDDECIEVFHVKTNETCEVFPPRPQDKGLSLENRNVRPNKQEAGSSKQFISGSLVFLLFAVTLIIISVLAVMAFPNSRSAVTTRVRGWVCGQITSSNPIHYSQVATDSRSQLVPLKELNNELNGDRLAFIPIATSDSPYNPTTAPFDSETDQISSNCISNTLHGSSKVPSPSHFNGPPRSSRHKMPLNKNNSATDMSQETNESIVDLLQ